MLSLWLDRREFTIARFRCDTVATLACWPLVVSNRLPRLRFSLMSLRLGCHTCVLARCHACIFASSLCGWDRHARVFARCRFKMLFALAFSLIVASNRLPRSRFRWRSLRNCCHARVFARFRCGGIATLAFSRLVCGRDLPEPPAGKWLPEPPSRIDLYVGGTSLGHLLGTVVSGVKMTTVTQN